MNVLSKIKRKLKEYHRVLSITKKPDFEEFKTSSKISGIGILIVGAIGFAIYIIFNLVRG